MFANARAAQRIERAEAGVTREMVAPLVGSARAPHAFVRPVDGGFAAFVRPGSPMNKLIGAGMEAPLDDALLDDLERAFAAHGEPVRAEISTMANPETAARLTARGYRLIGFENVLARAPTMPAPAGGDVRVARVDDAGSTAAWRDVVLAGFSCSDDTGVPVDSFTRDVIAEVIDDSLAMHTSERYLAFRDGVVAGGASMCVVDDVAVLTGSATLPAHRRHGIQAALVAARLADARARGADLAIITTAPGSQSMANVMKHSFALVYARAILVSS